MEEIKRILKEQGRSQVWLAKEIGVSPMTLNHWLNKRRVMPQEYKYRVSEAIGWK